MDKEYLQELVSEGKSTRDISDITGKSQTSIMYWLKKYEIKTTYASKEYSYVVNYCDYCGTETKSSESTFCSNTCFANKSALDFGELWSREGQHVLPESVLKTGLIVGVARRFIFLSNDNKCQECGWTHDFGDGSFPPLEICHINNDHSNNNLDNLELLCPNCHAIKTRLSPITKGFGRWSNNADSRNYSKGV